MSVAKCTKHKFIVSGFGIICFRTQWSDDTGIFVSSQMYLIYPKRLHVNWVLKIQLHIMFPEKLTNSEFLDPLNSIA